MRNLILLILILLNTKDAFSQLEQTLQKRIFRDVYHQRFQSVMGQLFTSKYKIIKDTQLFVVQLPSNDLTDVYDSSFHYVNIVDSTSIWGIPKVAYTKNLTLNNMVGWSGLYLSNYVVFNKFHYNRVIWNAYFTSTEVENALSEDDARFLKEVIYLNYREQKEPIPSGVLPTPEEKDISQNYFLNLFGFPYNNCLNLFEKNELKASVDNKTISYSDFINVYEFDTSFNSTVPVIDIGPSAVYFEWEMNADKEIQPYFNIKNHKLWFDESTKNEDVIALKKIAEEWDPWIKKIK